MAEDVLRLFIHSTVKMIEIDLTARLEEALKNPGDALWFPDLTNALVEASWQALHRRGALTPLTYGTARVLACDPNALCNSVVDLSLCSGGGDDERTSRIEILDQKLAHPYEETGIRFYTKEEIKNGDILKSLEDSIEVLNHVPTLAATVSSLVRSMHIIKPEDEDYDASFSDPHLPFSIFISVPRDPNLKTPLRVAEGIVHEAMHLQLTLIEELAPLVLLGTSNYYSPWKRKYRSPQDVLHALYVFRVIDQFLKALIPLVTLPSGANHISDRCGEIAEEISQVQSFQNCSELTPIGSRFVQSLLTG